MSRSIELTEEERKALLREYRSAGSVRTARRAQIILLLADGWSYREVRQVTFASYDLVAQCVAQFQQGRVETLLGWSGTTDSVPLWQVQVAQWVLSKTPQDFGYFRSRWSCETLAEVLAWETGQRKSRETIRRGLAQMDLVWRRPRPMVGPEDPEYDVKLAQLRQFLKALPPEETAVFEDEVDVHLNPKLGSCWMVRGHQAEMSTPGNNQKRHVAGSLHWRTGRLLVSAAGARRNAELFLAHLEDLRCRLKSYRTLHVVCDNAAFHTCRAVQDYLAQWAQRLRLHFLPKYAPETNPIERIWWRLHETITRNHRQPTIDALLDQVYDWFTTQRSFYTQTLAHYASPA